ncbi:unnamed protein product [Lactuca virosa]|uniref:RSE1/DDB1/CPSF1 second beta-propeller domain-containing protein n=1 Tax=Lactuca virosa TaxID=75947 RepID=A0AAU9NSF2_9ASTR|nr:unnamed protein product [Lactuca virosa]
MPHRADNIFKIQYSIGWSDPDPTLERNYLNQTRVMHNFMTPFVSKNPSGAFLNYRDLDIGVMNGDNYSEGYFKLSETGGHLLNFLLNTSTWELTDKKKVSLGTQPITLRTFSSNRSTHVFAASDRSTFIYNSSWWERENKHRQIHLGGSAQQAALAN